jgi:predicted nuclease of predicted toxin-antitoxin system
MWLLDANMDVHLLGVLSELGIRCESAIRKDWRELTNGELVSAAAKAGFTCILTHDKLFAESASRSLPSAPHLSIIVVHLPQRPWREYIRQFRIAWEKQPMAPNPGLVLHWPAD